MKKTEKSGVKEIQPITWTYDSEQKNEGFPWGPHKLPLNMYFEGFSLVVENLEQGIYYRRDGRDACVEKTMLTEKGNVLLSPVEPFHRPVGISTHLLVEFDRQVVIEPRSTRSILVTFPLELACAVKKQGTGTHVLEIFSLSRTKFTLYGSIRNGLICKYWKSSVYHSIPKVNPIEQGVMQLSIQNTSSRWVELNKAAFSAQGMKIYYSPYLVSMKATIKIINDFSAETNFLDEPLKKGMNKAFEQFTARLISLPAKTVMEEGY